METQFELIKVLSLILSFIDRWKEDFGRENENQFCHNLNNLILL